MAVYWNFYCVARGRRYLISLASHGFLFQGAESALDTPAELTAFLKSDIEKWGKVIRAAGIKAE